MKKSTLLIYAALMVMMIMVISCDSETNAAQSGMDSTAVIVNEAAVEEGLNRIRFKDFKEDKDWLDNEYLRTLRTHIDDFNSGMIKDKSLEPYRDKIYGPFAIYNSKPAVFGGLYISVVFLYHTEIVYDAWVYSAVDEKKKKVTGYSFKYMIPSQSNERNLSKEQILEVAKEIPELKLIW